jgi:predicted  nucleic acid-binding Zn-ribbon protein
MKYALTTTTLPLALALAMTLGSAPAQAQSRIWRCGNTYTNNQSEALAQGCKPVEGGNVTVVEGTKVNGGAVRTAAAATSAPGTPRIEAADQKARDADARAILEAELKKAETRQAELLKEYNNGEPEKQGPEARNYQKYLDRVEELKASIARNENDIAGLRRELARIGTTAAK